MEIGNIEILTVFLLLGTAVMCAVGLVFVSVGVECHFLNKRRSRLFTRVPAVVTETTQRKTRGRNGAPEYVTDCKITFRHAGDEGSLTETRPYEVGQEVVVIVDPNDIRDCHLFDDQFHARPKFFIVGGVAVIVFFLVWFCYSIYVSWPNDAKQAENVSPPPLSMDVDKVHDLP